MSTDDTVEVDLTEDLPVNPLADAHTESPRTHQRKRRRTERPQAVNSSIESADDEPDIEIVGVVERYPVVLVDQQRRPRERRNPSSGEGHIEIVDESILTAQDKLERIRQMHLRGQTVNVGNNSRRTTSRTSNSPLSLRNPFNGIPVPALPHRGNGLNYDLFAALDRLLDRTPDAIRRIMGPEFATGGFISAQALANDSDNDILQRTLQASIDQAQYGSRVNVKDIRKSQDPGPATEGFTRSVTGAETLVCIICDNELGIARPDAPNSERVFFRGCGHVYCGWCTFELMNRRTKKKCPVSNCASCTPKKKNRFQELYI